MKNTLSIICFILFSASVSAQARLNKADDLYNLKSYWSAATQYERLVDSDHDTPQMRVRLANSYYFMGNYEKALEYYSKISLSEYQKEDLYNYIQVTKMHGDYIKSTELLNHFCGEFGDERCAEYNQNPNYLIELRGKTHFNLKETKLNTYSNEFGAYQFNGNDIYILSDRGSSGFIKRRNLYNGEGFLDIYRVQKEENDSYSKAKKVKGKVNSRLNEGSMFITSDNKRIYFTRNNPKPALNGLYHLSIYMADIDEKGKWVNVRGLSINSDNHSVGHPVLTKDGKKMIFSSTIEGGHGGADLYIGDVTENGDVTNIKNMGNTINTPRNEFFPWLNTDGNLYFTSDGHPGFGGLDNFVAVMAGTDVIKVLNCGANVNSSQDDFALTLSKDGKNGYVSSNRVQGKGDDIYAVQLVNPFPRMITLTGKTTDLLSNNTLGNVDITFKDAKTGEIVEAKSDENGTYSVFVPADSDLELAAQKEDYLPATDKISTTGTNLTKNIALEENLGTTIHFQVKDKGNKAPLQDVKITIKDKTGKPAALPGITNEAGDFKQLIEDTKTGDQLNYRIKVEKSGFASKEVSFDHLVTMSGEIYFPIELDKLEIGKDLASMIALNPIYFDLNSSKVREDAKVELDKIIEVLNENPTMIIELGSHTDCRSSAKYNLTLSDKRAKASADYIKKGITQPSRVSGKGYGESKLLNNCACEGKVTSDCTEEEHAINRRTEFRIIKF